MAYSNWVKSPLTQDEFGDIYISDFISMDFFTTTLTTIVSLWIIYEFIRRHYERKRLYLTHENYLDVLDFEQWKEIKTIKDELETKHKGYIANDDLYRNLNHLALEGFIAEQNVRVFLNESTSRDSKVYRRISDFSPDEEFENDPYIPQLVGA